MLFGRIVSNEVVLNKGGLIARDEWLKTAQMRLNIQLDEFVIMPNHIHGIIIIDNDSRGTMHRAPTIPPHIPMIEQFGKPTPSSIPTIVRGFKSAVTNHINQTRNTHGVPVWQRNYYEHVIRDEISLDKLREYIRINPQKWAQDALYQADDEPVSGGISLMDHW